MLAFFGDIHGDLAALQAVVSELRKRCATRLMCLGDIVNMFPDKGEQQNEECVQFLQEMDSPAVMGNHDLGLSRATNLLSWNVRQYLTSLPYTSRELSPQVFVSHASLIEPRAWEGAGYENELKRAMRFYPGVNLFVLGHRHRPLLIAVRRSRPREGAEGSATDLLWNATLNAGEEKVFDLDFQNFVYLAVCGAVSCPFDPAIRNYGMLFDESKKQLIMFRNAT